MAFSDKTIRTSGLISDALMAEGFVSVFEHVKPCAVPGDHVFTLWINSSGAQRFSVVDGLGNYSVYRLEQISTFPPRPPVEDANG